MNHWRRAYFLTQDRHVDAVRQGIINSHNTSIVLRQLNLDRNDTHDREVTHESSRTTRGRYPANH